MDLPPNGTVISGGAFYSVSGNVNQVANARAPPVSGVQDQGRLGPRHTPLVIRSLRGSRQGDGWPYPASNNRQHRNIPPERDNGSTSRAGLLPEPSLSQECVHGGVSGDGELLPEARDLSQDPQFGDVGSDTDSSGIDTLHRYVVMEALYDSGEQPPELVCTPGARTEMLQDLKSWSVDEGIEPILWLHGPAGVGKSTITQMFAGDCNKQGRLGASFRFRRGHPKSQTWGGLITTIAFQLVGAVPEIFMLLQQAIESDKLIFGRSIPIQFQRLLVEPFKTTSSLRIIPVVVLDGLDECADHKQQQQILRLFIKAIRDGQLPIRLLIASRPELHLREVFEDQVVVPLCRQKVLVADTVIELYLRHEFSRIHSQFGSRGIDLGESWPSSDTLNRLTHKSSGSFTYATTVIRWLDTEYSHPADRLTSVMALDPDSTVPLDDLYAQILSMFPDERRQRLVLYIMLHEPRPLALVPEDVDMVLGLSEGTSRLMLRGLRSLLQFPPLQDPLVKEEFVTPIHSSFIDYIYDARRSGKWCTSDPSLYGELFKSVVHFLSDPASTCFRMLRRKIVAQLPKLLRGITPSDDLIDLLRNTYFQQSIFIDTHGEHEGHLKWPERDSLYPLDLIQLWEDRNWIADLVCQLGGCKEVEDIDPTFKLDSIYATIFSEHPDVLSLVRALILHSRPPRTASKVPPPSALWDTLNSSLCTLKPFLVIRNLGYSFQMGDSPADFLQDRRRAGSLYYNPEGIEEEGVLDWIHSAKQPDSSRENLVSTKFQFGLHLLEHCGLSERILRELESLDLAYACRQANIDRSVHKVLHQDCLSTRNFRGVLRWISKFPELSGAKALAFWKRQLVDIIRCRDLCK